MKSQYWVREKLGGPWKNVPLIQYQRHMREYGFVPTEGTVYPTPDNFGDKSKRVEGRISETEPTD